jgi:hypothetical protein
MNTFLLLATSALSIATSPVIAAETRPAAALASQGTDAVARAPSQAAPRYCIIEQITGSHIPHKLCKTRAEWMANDNFDPLAKQQ